MRYLYLAVLVAASLAVSAAPASAHHESPCVSPALSSAHADPPETSVAQPTAWVMATLSSHACPGDVAEIRDDDNNLISSWQFGAGAPSTFGASVYPGLNRTRSYDVTFNGGGQGVVIEDVGWVGEGSLSVDDSDLDAYNTSVWLELELGQAHAQLLPRVALQLGRPEGLGQWPLT
jgi:hypothetical protein